MTNPDSFLDSLFAALDSALKETAPKTPPAFNEILALVLGATRFAEKADSPYDDPRAPDTVPEALLPTLRAGIYRHFKNGHLYQVLGYARDAEPPSHDPDRVVVVYFSTKPTTTGHSMFTRPVQHFFQQVCSGSGRPLGTCTQHLLQSDCTLTERFTYLGPEYLADANA